MQRRSSRVVLSEPNGYSYLATTRAFTETTMEFEGVGEIIASRQLHYFDDENRKR